MQVRAAHERPVEFLSELEATLAARPRGLATIIRVPVVEGRAALTRPRCAMLLWDKSCTRITLDRS